MKTFFNLSAILFLTVLQWSILPAAGFSWPLPPLILPFLLCWSELGRVNEAILWGGIALAILDLVGNSSLSLFCGGAAFLAAFFGLRQVLHWKGRIFAGISSAASILIYFLLYFLCLLIFDNISYFWLMPYVLGLSAVFGFLITLLFPLTAGLKRLVESWEINSRSFLR